MARSIFVEMLLFFVPFVAFAIYLVVRRQHVFRMASWNDQLLWLVIAGLVLAIGAMLYTGFVAERRQGPFVPTHLENGRLVPGQFK